MQDIFNKIANFVETKVSYNEKLKNNKIINYYCLALRRGMDFSGRSNRAEFWYFVLANVIMGFVVAVLECIILMPFAILANIINNNAIMMFGGLINICLNIALGIYELIVMVPSISICIRRLHDINKSGWFLLIGFCCCPVVIILWCLPSVESNNNYNAFKDTVTNNNVNNNTNNQQTQVDYNNSNTILDDDESIDL